MTGRIVPAWLRSILGIPLEAKLIGANLIILGVAVLLLLEPTHIQPGRLTFVYVVVVSLIIGATVNFTLVRLALRPINDLERVAKRVSEGRLSERVPASIVADRGLTHLSTTINEMLDTLQAELGFQVVHLRLGSEGQDEVKIVNDARNIGRAVLSHSLLDRVEVLPLLRISITSRI